MTITSENTCGWLMLDVCGDIFERLVKVVVFVLGLFL